MRNATGAVQSAVVLGGNSDIANALLALLADGRLNRVLLAVRKPTDAAERVAALRSRGVDAAAVVYDANDPIAHDAVLSSCGDVDLILLAFGTLGDRFELESEPTEAAELARTNFVGGIGAAHASARHLARQGHGSLVVFSSVAGARVRAANAVYGAGKAGLDSFSLALADAVHGTGAHVMVVRPGFVRSKMTEGMDDSPFATTPERVAKDVVRGLRRRRRVVWSPPVLRGVFAGLKTLPSPLWRRLGQ